MNSSIGAETSACDNWNSNPTMMPFVGLESNNQKQFWNWETNRSAADSFINPNNTNNFISSSFHGKFSPYSHAIDYHNGFLKSEEEGCFGIDGGDHNISRIGLNLGHRTYFSSRETALIDRLFKRPRGFYQANQVPKCQAQGCQVDLTNAKHYHRRHKVCEFHSKATRVIAAGLEQRFCQQCSRFHVLAEFDEAKRSCRKRLADHNRRRRKPQPRDSEPVAAFSQQSSSTISENTERSQSSAPLLMIPEGTSSMSKQGHQHQNKVTHLQNGPALSLGGVVERRALPHFSYSYQKPFDLSHITNPISSTFFARENVSNPCMITTSELHHNLFFSSSIETSQSTGGESNQSQFQPEEVQNLLHLGRTMFQVELL